MTLLYQKMDVYKTAYILAKDAYSVSITEEKN